MAFFSKYDNKQEKEEVVKPKVKQEETPVDKVKINIGTGGIKAATYDNRKKYDYEKIRKEITGELLERILEVEEAVDTKNQLFSQLEDDGVPLIHLVALGVASEEAVEAYQTLRSRGYDTHKVDTSTSQSVDTDYANEVKALSKEKPTLVSIDGIELPEPVTPTELYKKELEKRLEVGKELDKTRKEVHHLQIELHALSELPKQDTYRERVDRDIQEVTHVIDLSESFDDIEDDAPKISPEESLAWRDALESLKDRTIKEAKEIREQEKQQELEEAKEEVGLDTDDGAVKSIYNRGVNVETNTDKDVYILSVPFDYPKDLKGYNIHFVETQEDLDLFTSRRNNLLVLTQSPPRTVTDMFVSWVQAVKESGIEYRIVTLKGLELTHDLIEATVEITQESLDNYYEQHKLDKYVGDGLGSFFSIDYVLEDEF